MVVLVGLADAELLVGASLKVRPVLGFQLYVLAPEAVRLTGEPPGLQIEPLVGVTLITGRLLMVSVISSDRVVPVLSQVMAKTK